eukprot:2710761-Rhodomonas_salina.3
MGGKGGVGQIAHIGFGHGGSTNAFEPFVSGQLELTWKILFVGLEEEEERGRPGGKKAEGTREKYGE